MIGYSSLTAVIALTLAGCGSAFNGTYALQQTGGPQCSTGYTLGSTTQSVNMVITQNGSGITGTGSGSCGAESLVGTVSGNSGTATLTITSQTYGATCTYNGPITVQSNVISGTLNAQNNSGITSYGYCGTSVSFTGTKTN